MGVAEQGKEEGPAAQESEEVMPTSKTKPWSSQRPLRKKPRKRKGNPQASAQKRVSTSYSQI